MKIVHLVDYFQPSLGYQEFFLAKEQQRLGHDVTVLTSERFAPFPAYASTIQPILGNRLRSVGRFTERGISVWRLQTAFEWRSRCLIRGVRAALHELRPDVVHAHNILKFTTIQAILAKRRLGFRLVLDDHQHPVDVDRSIFGKLTYGGFRTCLAKIIETYADAIVGVTDEIAAVMQTVYGLDPNKTRVIELGVDTALFKFNATARDEVRAGWQYSTNDFVVIYTGKVIPQKGLHWLIEAVAQCPDTIRLIILGNSEPSYAQQLRALANKLGVSQRIRFQPAVPQAELPRFYSGADAACWPRGVSIATLEAASCMLPIVIATGTVDQRIAAGNGLAYREGDVADLANALKTLSADPREARTRGLCGARFVQQEHSWAAINQQFLQLYAA